jgi:hypothetical protein
MWPYFGLFSNYNNNFVALFGRGGGFSNFYFFLHAHLEKEINNNVGGFLIQNNRVKL